MSAPSTALNSTSNPLQDDELSDLTKKEILFWSKKLKVTPSELFTLTKEELDVLLNNYIQNENDKRGLEAEEKLFEKILEAKQNSRLKGGAGSDLLNILCRAARDIERIYKGGRNRSSSYDECYDDDEDDDDDWSDVEFVSSDESTFAPDFVSTPIPVQARPAANRTYNVRNATYKVAPQNATYKVAPQNATYNVAPQNATYNVAAKNATCRCPSPCQQIAAISPPAGFQSSQDNSFRNYTDYSIKYGPCGSREAASSISVQNFDECSGQVTATSRTFTLPPATSATSAIALSKISPPQLASGLASPRRARSPVMCPPIQDISQPELASGASPADPCNPCNIADISPPAEMQVAANMCPHLAAALADKTPLRYRPNRPYRPRRIC